MAFQLGPLGDLANKMGTGTGVNPGLPSVPTALSAGTRAATLGQGSWVGADGNSYQDPRQPGNVDWYGGAFPGINNISNAPRDWRQPGNTDWYAGIPQSPFTQAPTGHLGSWMGTNGQVYGSGPPLGGPPRDPQTGGIGNGGQMIDQWVSQHPDLAATAPQGNAGNTPAYTTGNNLPSYPYGNDVLPPNSIPPSADSGTSGSNLFNWLTKNSKRYF